MSQSTFFTIFWILYFPLCIAFYESVNYYVDEIMTLILILYTLCILGKRTNRYPLKDAVWVVAVLVFYLVYSLIRQINVPTASLIDFQQQVRPYAVLFCTWILKPRLSSAQHKLMLASILLTFTTYLVINRSRVGDDEDIVFGALAMSSAIAYYMFTKSSPANRNIAILIALLGLLCGKYKYIGECVAFIGVIFFIRKKIHIGSWKSYVYAGILVSAVLYFAWDRFDKYFIEGGGNDQLARPMMYKTAPKVIADYLPFGPGLATFGTSASAKTYYSPLYHKYKLDQIWGMAQSDRGAFNADSFYPSLAQFGLVGLILFVWFWWRRLKDVNRIVDIKYYKIALMAILCLAIESVADTSYLSGRGMAYFMVLGISLNMRAPKVVIRKKAVPKEINDVAEQTVS